MYLYMNYEGCYHNVPLNHWYSSFICDDLTTTWSLGTVH